MPVPSDSRALLLVYAEPAQRARLPSTPSDNLNLFLDADENKERDEFETWHDRTHVPALLARRTITSAGSAQPLFVACTRWAAADCRAPTHLCLYDLAAPGAVHDPAYLALVGGIGDSDPAAPPPERREHEDWDGGGWQAGAAAELAAAARDVLDKMRLVDRRVYEPLAHASLQSPSPPLNWDGWARRGEDLIPTDGEGGGAGERTPRHGRYMTVIEVEMHKFAEGEFNRWFDEEHIPLLMHVPGWVRSRRFALKERLGVSGTGVGEGRGRWKAQEGSDGDSAETDGGRDGMRRKEERPPKYIAMHEWASLDAFWSREFAHATSTPWRAYVLQEDRVLRYEMRVFRFVGGWTGCEQ